MSKMEHEKAEECLDEMMVLGLVMQTAGNSYDPGELPARWMATMGCLIHRLACLASDHLGDIPERRA